MHPTRLATTAFLASLALLAVACGGDEEAATPTPAATEAVTDAPDEAAEAPNTATEAPDEAAGGTEPGVAVLTIGDESWTFDGIFCAASPEEAGNDRVSFTLSSSGDVDGTRVQLDATIQDPEEQGRLEGDGVIYSVSINDVEDFEDPAISWSAPSGFAQLDSPLITVDGASVSAEGPFDDGRTEEIEEVSGTLVATCP